VSLREKERGIASPLLRLQYGRPIPDFLQPVITLGDWAQDGSMVDLYRLFFCVLSAAAMGKWSAVHFNDRLN
jgi:hypothetical protein